MISRDSDPMIPRYTRAEMGRVWSDEGKFQRWLDVEIAATETLAERGVVPREAAERGFASARGPMPHALPKLKRAYGTT